MEKISDDAILKSITDTIIETFDAMMSLELVYVDSDEKSTLDDNRMVGSVNFGGEVVGCMSFHMSGVFAELITLSMLGMEPEEIEGEDEIKDVLGELSNIVTGNLKSDFIDAGLNCVISTPSTTIGSNFKIEPITIAEPRQFFYKHKDHILMVELCVREELGSADIMSGREVLSSEAIMEKIKSVDIKTSVINAVIDVFYTMLEMEVEAIQVVPDTFTEELRTVGTVSFAGEVDGMFNIQVNDHFGKIMTAAMLGMEVDEVEGEEEIFDVIRELSNIIGGNLKSTFTDAGLSCVLSTPSITNGLDFKVEPSHILSPNFYLFSYEDHTIIVEAGIKQESPPVQDEAEAAAVEAVSGEESTVAGGKPSDIKVQNKGDFKKLDFIYNIPLDVTVELGRTRKRLNEVLALGPGSVVELEQLEGEPVDILVNKTLIAKGVVVVEKEKYGIRISEIISRQERMNSFG